MKLTWSPDAQFDLREGMDFIAKDNPRAADRVEDRLLQAADHLCENPQSGRVGLRRGTRELVVLQTPYLLVYRVKASEIEIVRVWHTSRRPYGDPAD